MNREQPVLLLFTVRIKCVLIFSLETFIMTSTRIKLKQVNFINSCKVFLLSYAGYIQTGKLSESFRKITMILLISSEMIVQFLVIGS